MARSNPGMSNLGFAHQASKALHKLSCQSLDLPSLDNCDVFAVRLTLWTYRAKCTNSDQSMNSTRPSITLIEPLTRFSKCSPATATASEQIHPRWTSDSPCWRCTRRRVYHLHVPPFLASRHQYPTSTPSSAPRLLPSRYADGVVCGRRVGYPCQSRLGRRLEGDGRRCLTLGWR